MFRYSLNIIRGLYIIRLRYVYKIYRFQSEGLRPKMRLFFHFWKILKKKLIFLSVFITLIIISD